MADGYPQPRTLRDDLAQLCRLSLVVGQRDGEEHVVALHQAEGAHHLVARQRLPQQPVGRDGDAPEAVDGYQVEHLLVESRMKEVGHATGEEAVGVLPLHLGEVVVLKSVNELLHHHGCRHLRIVHIREEHLSRVPSVRHKGGKHLHLLAQEERAAILRRADDLAVPAGVLS